MKVNGPAKQASNGMNPETTACCYTFLCYSARKVAKAVSAFDRRKKGDR